ncbi:hypothetical protein [Negadavirga shengliensis]|uniref:Acyltransferase 3 domain-containing protein n=1 Tax=Negadavirga shengliensis TaxID=1389218 RepID=A0ABV9T6R5_9BACT
MILLLPGLWLGVGEAWLRPLFPTTHAFYNDWASHFLYISIFLLGFVIVSSSHLQERIRNLRWYALGTGLLLVTVLYTQFWISETGFAMMGPRVYRYIISINRWCWLLAILGFAFRHLNKKSAYLPKLNEMVYPFYILHQTVIILLGFFVKDLAWTVGEKFSVVVIATFMICYGTIRYFIMKFDFLRLLFGLKPIQQKQLPYVKDSIETGNIPA